MATSQEDYNTVDDSRVCSICFERFKTPRYLPCNHSFCTNCLFSYIVGQCKSTEPRLGFHCPNCRVYIPCDGDPEKPETWAELFPLNDILQKMIQCDAKYCEPCKRENDEEEAIDYCISCKEYLCASCTKYHKRNMASHDHNLFKASEMKSIQVIPQINISDCCPKHRHEKVQLYCHDHDQPMCGLCGGTEHRKCEKVDTIENALQVIRESGQIDSLLNKMIEFQKKLLKVKTEEEKNISEMESKVDEYLVKTEEEMLALVDKLEKMKREHSDEIASTTKQGKEKLQKEIDKLEDVILCIDHCKAGMEKTQSAGIDTDILIQFSRAKKKFQSVKHLQLTQINVKISEEKTPVWMELTKLEKIANATLSLSVSFPFFDFDIKTMKLSEIKELTIKDGVVFNGSLLSEERFLVVNYIDNGSCNVYDYNWKCIHVIGGLHKPYGVCQSNQEIFVTDRESQVIEVFSHTDFHKLRSIPMNHKVHGITSWNCHLYVACGKEIIKFDRMGQILNNYDVGGVNNINIIATKEGLIVYSDWTLHTVKAMTDEGCFVWKYQSENLRQPLGLDLDSNDHIFISGKESNNIHVLTNSGELIRVIEHIPKPNFCKLIEDKSILCVSSGNKNLKIYQIKTADSK